jgi:hypothetical protein
MNNNEKKSSVTTVLYVVAFFVLVMTAIAAVMARNQVIEYNELAALSGQGPETMMLVIEVIVIGAVAASLIAAFGKLIEYVYLIKEYLKENSSKNEAA